MPITDLLPFGRGRGITTGESGMPADPFAALHRDMNRLFDDFSRGFGLPAPARAAWSTTWPQIEVSETEKEVKLVAELPGLEEKDLDLSLRDGVLVLMGEKTSESSGPVYSERWLGKFRRSLQLGPDVDPDRVEAAFKNGVLTVTLQKRAEAQSTVKHIAIGKA